MNEQKAAVPAETEVDINNPLHPLHPSNGDLRIVPVGWTPAEAGPKDVLSHHDLRLKAVDSKRD